LIFRTPWDGFPDVTVQTTVPKLKAHPDYAAAKSGNPDAAIRVINQLFKPGKVTDPCDLVVPVLQLDREKQNMLAVAYAVQLAHEIGAELFLGVAQSNQVSHTGSSAITRILGQPTFAGTIPPGSRVLIVDDVATFGSTLANLRGWIEHQGAHVVRATTLSASFGGTKLAQPKPVLDKLLRQFPEVEILTQNLGFTPDCLTGRETYFLAQQVPTREQMLLLVAASEKVRPLLNPIGEYDHQLEQLIRQCLSKADARNSLATIAPDLVSTRDNQVIIQRRAQLSAEQRANTQENKSRQRL
jgi:Phosphoribosyl transferase domain